VPAERWVCLDVGETLIDETRIWSAWADELRIPRLSFMAGFGIAAARGGDHHQVFGLFGIDDEPLRATSVEAAYGGFQPADLYPDVTRAIERLRANGHRVSIIANQPAIRTAQLRAIGVDADVIAMSEEIGASKPNPKFFAAALELMGSPPPGSVAYVGDRVDNDVLPSIAAGLRAVWIRRGPYGLFGALPDGVRPALTIYSLDELVERIDEAWED